MAANEPPLMSLHLTQITSRVRWSHELDQGLLPRFQVIQGDQHKGPGPRLFGVALLEPGAHFLKTAESDPFAYQTLAYDQSLTHVLR